MTGTVWKRQKRNDIATLESDVSALDQAFNKELLTLLCEWL